MQADSTGRIQRARADFGKVTDLLEQVYQDGPAERPNITIYRVPDPPSAAVVVR